MNNWTQYIKAKFALKELIQRGEVITIRNDLMDLCDKYGYNYILGVYFKEDSETTLYYSGD